MEVTVVTSGGAGDGSDGDIPSLGSILSDLFGMGGDNDQLPSNSEVGDNSTGGASSTTEDEDIFMVF